MGYRFKLEALRRFRCHEEERRQKELAAAQRSVAAAQESLDQHLDLKKTTELEFGQHQLAGAVTGPQAAMYRSYVKQLAEKIVQQRQVLLSAQQQMEITREALLEAMKKRKAIDKLKENELEAYLQESNRQELKFIDEIAISRFLLNQR